MIPVTRRLLTLAFSVMVSVACATPGALPSPLTPSPRGAPTLPASEPPATITQSADNPTPAPARTATVTEAVNQVQARYTATDSWATARLNQILTVGSEVQTLAESQARIDLSEGTIIRLGSNSLFTVTELSGSNYDPITRLTLVAGELWVILNESLHSGSLDVETPVGIAAVRGSYLSVNYDPQADHLLVSCLEGLCELRNELGSVAVRAGEEASILIRGQRIDTPRAMSPEQLDRWQQFVKEAGPFIEPLRQQLEALRSTQAALDVTLQPGLLRTLVATLPAPPGGGLRP